MGPMRQVDELEAARETAKLLLEAGTYEDDVKAGRRAIYDASVLHGVCKHALYTRITGRTEARS